MATGEVEAYLTPVGGNLGPVTFDLGGRKIQPFNIAPWYDEDIDPSNPPIMFVLRGDFFCMPFGMNERPFRGEQHPPHGDVCNGDWTLKDYQESEEGVRLVAGLDLKTRPGHVEKTILLRTGQTAVYQTHRISGVAGPMPLGHHAMLKFPDREGVGLVSTSPFVFGSTAPLPVERAENMGYSILEPNRRFDSLRSVPTVTGEKADLSRYPARKGYEDLVMLISEPRTDFAWTAVSVPSEGYIWFALKDPGVLTSTAMWISNRGRYYPPWNGRHECVLGLEEVTSYFHYGLAESVEDNPVSEMGYATSVRLETSEVLEVRYIMGVAPCPADFGHVQSIEPGGSEEIVIRSSGEAEVRAKVDWTHVRSGPG
jgi:hypothetical protein